MRDLVVAFWSASAFGVARAALTWSLVGAMSVACGGTSFTSAGDAGEGGADGAPGDGSTSDGGAVDSATGDAARFNCANGGGLPQPNKSCSGGGCAVVFHTIDCCGTKVAIGIQHSTVDAFNAVEAAWESQCATCGCAAQPTKGEDGCTPTTPNAFVPDCSSNTCRARCQ